MDQTVILIISLLVVGVVAVYGIVFRRGNSHQRAKTEIKGPLGTEFKAEASNDPAAITPGVKAKGIESRAGGVSAQDKTGRGVDAEDVKAEKDIKLINEGPREGKNPKV